MRSGFFEKFRYIIVTSSISCSHVAAALAGDAQWLLVQQMQDDGNIVRSEVPGHIDVFLKQAQVQPSRREMYWIFPMSPESTISFIRRTAGEKRKV